MVCRILTETFQSNPKIEPFSQGMTCISELLMTTILRYLNATASCIVFDESLKGQPLQEFALTLQLKVLNQHTKHKVLWYICAFTRSLFHRGFYHHFLIDMYLAILQAEIDWLKRLYFCIEVHINVQKKFPVCKFTATHWCSLSWLQVAQPWKS